MITHFSCLSECQQIVATYIAGEAVGALTQSAIGDILGRKRFMGLMCLVVRPILYSMPTCHLSYLQVTLGTVIQTAAQNFGMFLAGRIFTGIAV